VRAWLAKNWVTAATREFTFLLDRDGTLCRWDEWYVSDVWWAADEKRAGEWHRYDVNPFTANVTAITPARGRVVALSARRGGVVHPPSGIHLASCADAGLALNAPRVAPCRPGPRRVQLSPSN
jgi:hypothetical protein